MTFQQSGRLTSLGTFGTVYKGIWHENIDVALKSLQVDAFLDEFKREAALLASLKHPNIVRFFGIFTQQNRFYIVMVEVLVRSSIEIPKEYMTKGSLKQVLQNHGHNFSVKKLLHL